MSDIDLVFRENDDITCTFNGQQMKGIYVNETQALCISPELSDTGRVLFQLMIIGDEPDSVPFTREAKYISCK